MKPGSSAEGLKLIKFMEEIMISMIKLPTLLSGTALSKTLVYDKMDTNSPRYDPTFPKQVKIGPKAVAWVESEVDQWIEQRIAASRGGE